MVDRWLAHDWVLRVLSLLLAIGIWATLTQNQNPSTSRLRWFHHLPVAVQNVGHLHVAVAPTTVAVEVRGPTDIVNALQSSAVRVMAVVPYAQPGTYRVRLRVSAPVAGTTVIGTSPQDVTVRLLAP
jgi:YbbR domain-containing protein